MTRPQSWFRIKAAIVSAETDGDPADPEIMIYDHIGAYGVSVVTFAAEIKALGDVKAITMRVNSPGGDSFDGIAIYNILAANPATITCHVDGIAASAASLICMAADKIVAPKNAFMVVHNPYALTIGAAAAHRAMAEDLERITDAYALCYAARSKQPLDAVKALMDEDRLMGAEEAASLGYIDECSEPKTMAATYDLGKLRDTWRETVAAVYGRDAVEADEGRQDDPGEAEIGGTIHPNTALATTAKASSSGLPYGQAEIDETLEICVIARAPTALASKFIGARTPIARVREQLTAAAALAGDRAAITAIDTTADDIGVGASAAVGAAQRRNAPMADEKIVAGWKKVQAAVKGANGARAE